MAARSQDTIRLALRAVLTAILIAATVLGFLVGRPVVGVMLCFAIVSDYLLVVLLRAGRSPAR